MNTPPVLKQQHHNTDSEDTEDTEVKMPSMTAEKKETEKSKIKINSAKKSEKTHTSTSKDKKEDSKNQTMSIMSFIIHPILAYIVYALQKGPPAKIKDVITQHFTSSEIKEAKGELWRVCQEDLETEKNHRTTRERTAEMANVEDIIEAILKLDSDSKLPRVMVAAEDLHKIPRPAPEELNDISVSERLDRLELKNVDIQEKLNDCLADNKILKSILKRNSTGGTEIIHSSMIRSPSPSTVWSSSFTDQSLVEAAVINTQKEEHPHKEATLPSSASSASSVIKENSKTSQTYAEKVSSKSTPAILQTKPRDAQNNVSPIEQRAIQPPSSTTSEKAQVSAASVSEAASSSRVADSAVNGVNSVHKSSDNKNNEFEIPAYHRKKTERKKKKVIGEKKYAIAFGAEPCRSIFISRIVNNVSIDDVKDMIKTIGLDIRDLVKVSHKDARLQSFRLDIPKHQLHKAFNICEWPDDVVIQPYYRPKGTVTKP